MWDGSKFYETRSDCQNLKQYLDAKLGPLIRNISILLSNCSINRCSDHGRCVLSNWTTHASSLVTDLTLYRRSQNNIYDKEYHTFNEKCNNPFLKYLTKNIYNEIDMFSMRSFNPLNRINVMKNSWYTIMINRKMLRPVVHKSPQYVCQCYIGYKGEYCDETVGF